MYCHRLKGRPAETYTEIPTIWITPLLAVSRFLRAWRRVLAACDAIHCSRALIGSFYNSNLTRALEPLEESKKKNSVSHSFSCLSVLPPSLPILPPTQFCDVIN